MRAPSTDFYIGHGRFYTQIDAGVLRSMQDLRVNTLKHWLDWAVGELRDPDEARKKLQDHVSPLGQIVVWEVARAIGRTDQVDLCISNLDHCLLYRRNDLREFSLRYFELLVDLHGRRPEKANAESAP